MVRVRLSIHDNVNHTSDTSHQQELLLNPELLPDVAPGDLLEIVPSDDPASSSQPSSAAAATAPGGAPPDPPSARLVLQVSEGSLAHAGARELAHGAAVSVVKVLADLFGLKARSAVLVRRLRSADEAGEAELDFVELLVKEQYISRAEIWQLQRGLLTTCVYAGKLVLHGGLRLQVQRLTLRATGRLCMCGLISARTRLVFRSRSQHFMLLLQLAAESYTFADDGELYFEKMVAFVSRLLAEWTRRGVTHSLTLVLFARRVRPAGGAGGGEGEPTDLFKVVCDRKTLVDWTQLVRLLKAEVLRFLPCAQWRAGVGGAAAADGASGCARAGERSAPGSPLVGAASAAPRASAWSTGARVNLSSAACGNLVEALNLSLDAIEEPFLNRELSKTGQQIVLVSPSSGYFECPAELLRLTSARMEASGTGCDLVCLGRPPRHTVPLILATVRAQGKEGGSSGGSASGPSSPLLGPTAAAHVAHATVPTGGTCSGGGGGGGGGGATPAGNGGRLGFELHSPDWLNTMFTDPPLPFNPAASRAVAAVTSANTLDLSRASEDGERGGDRGGGDRDDGHVPHALRGCADGSPPHARRARTLVWPLATRQPCEPPHGAELIDTAQSDVGMFTRACAAGASATVAAAAVAAAALAEGRLCEMPAGARRVPLLVGRTWPAMTAHAAAPIFRQAEHTHTDDRGREACGPGGTPSPQPSGMRRNGSHRFYCAGAGGGSGGLNAAVAGGGVPYSRSATFLPLDLLPPSTPPLPPFGAAAAAAAVAAGAAAGGGGRSRHAAPAGPGACAPHAMLTAAAGACDFARRRDEGACGGLDGSEGALLCFAENALGASVEPSLLAALEHGAQGGGPPASWQHGRLAAPTANASTRTTAQPHETGAAGRMHGLCTGAMCMSALAAGGGSSPETSAPSIGSASSTSLTEQLASADACAAASPPGAQAEHATARPRAGSLVACYPPPVSSRCSRGAGSYSSGGLFAPAGAAPVLPAAAGQPAHAHQPLPHLPTHRGLLAPVPNAERVSVAVRGLPNGGGAGCGGACTASAPLNMDSGWCAKPCGAPHVNPITPSPSSSHLHSLIYAHKSAHSGLLREPTAHSCLSADACVPFNPLESQPAPAGRLEPKGGARAVTARQWLHVVSSSLYSPSERMWLSLCEPALLPLRTDEVPPLLVHEDLSFDLASHTVDSSLLQPPRRGAEVRALLDELICQRLEQDFQLIAQPEQPDRAAQLGAPAPGGAGVPSAPPHSSTPARAPTCVAGGISSAEASSSFYLCMGHSFHLLQLKAKEDGVHADISVTMYRKKRAEQQLQCAYACHVCGADHDGYEPHAATFRSRQGALFNWNHLDFMVAGWIAWGEHEWMESRVVAFVLLSREGGRRANGAARGDAPLSSHPTDAAGARTESAAGGEEEEDDALRSIALEPDAFRKFVLGIESRVGVARDVAISDARAPSLSVRSRAPAATTSPAAPGARAAGAAREKLAQTLTSEGADGRALSTVVEMDRQMVPWRAWRLAFRWRLSVGVTVDELLAFLRRKALNADARLVQVPAGDTHVRSGRAMGGPFSPPFIVPCAHDVLPYALRALTSAHGGFDFVLEREGELGPGGPGARYVQRKGIALVEVRDARFAWVSNALHAPSGDEGGSKGGGGKVRSSLEMLADFRRLVALEHQRRQPPTSLREVA
ncbi:hypothetical protein KFE25_007165 [Diacronema lutheri]|uniref:Vacuolar membrane-associated protein Iml1 N-terminal domain-containing protein n=2 Tax=Diacronema lutheri TaxID=2081491 RepID=A0A8J6CHU3_DIALT|nr:hypothetical protein KFE25_007165 [Diacronema lutheri]